MSENINTSPPFEPFKSESPDADLETDIESNNPEGSWSFFKDLLTSEGLKKYKEHISEELNIVVSAIESEEASYIDSLDKGHILKMNDRVIEASSQFKLADEADKKLSVLEKRRLQLAHEKNAAEDGHIVIFGGSASSIIKNMIESSPQPPQEIKKFVKIPARFQSAEKVYVILGADAQPIDIPTDRILGAKSLQNWQGGDREKNVNGAYRLVEAMKTLPLEELKAKLSESLDEYQISNLLNQLKVKSIEQIYDIDTTINTDIRIRAQSRTVIELFALFDINTAPPLTEMTVYQLPDGNVYFYSSNAHRAAAAKKRGDDFIKFDGQMNVVPIDEQNVERFFSVIGM